MGKGMVLQNDAAVYDAKNGYRFPAVDTETVGCYRLDRQTSPTSRLTIQFTRLVFQVTNCQREIRQQGSTNPDRTKSTVIHSETLCPPTIP